MEAPTATKDGLTFFPIPDVSRPEMAFGLSEKAYFSRRALPEVPRKYITQANELFFNGGKLPALADGVDASAATRYLSALLCSFAPPHESKETTAAYALWVWTTPDAIAAAAA